MDTGCDGELLGPAPGVHRPQFQPTDAIICRRYTHAVPSENYCRGADRRSAAYHGGAPAWGQARRAAAAVHSNGAIGTAQIHSCCYYKMRVDWRLCVWSVMADLRV